MARTSKGRPEKKKIYLFVEGETEQKYFDFLRQKLRLSNVQIKTVLLDNSGQNWLEKANRVMKNDAKFKRDKNTAVYVIFDKDDVTESSYQKMQKNAKKDNITIGFSNTMFEVWLLAHFQKVSNGSLQKNSLLSKLTTYLGQEYQKANSSQLEKIVGRYQVAIDNAATISEVDFFKQSTNIGEIISEIQQA